MQNNGQLLQADFFANTGGLNTSNTPFSVADGQATGGANYNYSKTGGIVTRRGHEKVNTVADSKLYSLGLGMHTTSAGVKTNIRAADRVLQSVSVDSAIFTSLSEDTAVATTVVFSAGITQQVVFSQFNTSLGNVLWAAGANLTNLVGITGASKYTHNGVIPPAGTFSGIVNTSAGGTFAAPGLYWYGLAYRKGSTFVTSNVALDTSVTTVNASDTVTLSWTLTGLDTTRIDQIYIYRSGLSGVTGFTTGDIIAQLPSTSITYTDTGNSVSSAQNVPRANNLLLDNSVLPAGTFNTLATFKRRLVTSTGSTLYLSELNKPESWPTSNVITIPSGGDIKGLAIISFSTDLSNDEYLAVFKERELWIITGSSIADYSLKFVDSVGTATQSLIVGGSGYLSWIDYMGIYLWDGAGKPMYISKPIENLFDKDGDLDKANLNLGVGVYSRKQHEIIWFLSHKIYGVQKFAIKMDLRLTLPNVKTGIEGRVFDGCFLYDVSSIALYAALSYIPTSAADEVILLGDASGFVYRGYNVYADGGAAYSMTYATKFLDCGNPNRIKRFMAVIVWVDQVGSWPLYMDYWTGYRSENSIKSTLDEPITTTAQNASALWDIAYWDVASWDDYTSRSVPIIFYINPDTNNNQEGPCIRLQFRQDSVNSPVAISGFSVLYNEEALLSNRGQM